FIAQQVFFLFRQRIVQAHAGQAALLHLRFCFAQAVAQVALRDDVSIHLGDDLIHHLKIFRNIRRQAHAGQQERTTQQPHTKHYPRKDEWTGRSGLQNGSGAAINSIGTSGINGFSQSAQYFMPACSDATWPSRMSAFFCPDTIASCAYSTTSHSRVSPPIRTSTSGWASRRMPGIWLM